MSESVTTTRDLSTSTFQLITSGCPAHNVDNHAGVDGGAPATYQQYTVELPLLPVDAQPLLNSVPSFGGPIGIAIDGAFLYNTYLQDEISSHLPETGVVRHPSAFIIYILLLSTLLTIVANNNNLFDFFCTLLLLLLLLLLPPQDQCFGRSDELGRYHYHQLPLCLLELLGGTMPLRSEWSKLRGTNNATLSSWIAAWPVHGTPSPLLGWGLDGVPIYGPYDETGTLL